MQVGTLIEWILANRKGKVFAGWSESQVACHVLQMISDKTILFSQNSRGLLNGVVTWGKMDNKVLHIHNILTTDKRVMIAFLEKFKEQYPGWSLEAQRYGHIHHYRTRRFLQLAEQLNRN